MRPVVVTGSRCRVPRLAIPLVCAILAAVSLGACGGDSAPAPTGQSSDQGSLAPSSEETGSTIWVTNATHNSVAAYDGASGDLLATIPVGSTPIGVTAPPRTGKVYVSDEGSNQVSVIAKAGREVVARIPTGPKPHHMAQSPDGRFVYIAEFGTNKVGVIDTATDTLLAEYITGSATARSHAVWVSSDGALLYVANSVVNELAALDARTGAIRWVLPVGTNPSEVLVAPDGGRAFVSVRNENKLQVVDLTTLAITNEVVVGEQPDTLALTPDGRLLVVGLRGRPARVALVDLARDLVVRWVDLDGITTGHNAVSADGRFSYVALEGPVPALAVIDHTSASVIGVHPYPDGGRPHGVWHEPSALVKKQAAR